MMTIYKVEGTIYSYWYTEDRSGWTKIEKYFSTEEKANKWAKEIVNKWYDSHGNLVEIDKESIKGSAKVVKVEVE